MYQQDTSCPKAISEDLLLCLKELVFGPESWQLLLLPPRKPKWILTLAVFLWGLAKPLTVSKSVGLMLDHALNRAWRLACFTPSRGLWLHYIVTSTTSCCPVAASVCTTQVCRLRGEGAEKDWAKERDLGDWHDPAVSQHRRRFNQKNCQWSSRSHGPQISLIIRWEWSLSPEKCTSPNLG